MQNFILLNSCNYGGHICIFRIIKTLREPIVLLFYLLIRNFLKDVRASEVDRGYTDYSEEYILSEAEKVDYIF